MKQKTARIVMKAGRDVYLHGKADGQDNLIERILADWKQLHQLNPPELRRQLLNLKHWRPTKAWKSGERDEFPMESACARQNEIKDLAIMLVI